MDILTVKKAAERLGISTKRISKLCKEGTIRAERIGERLYAIDPSSLEEYRHSETRKIYTPNTFSPGRTPGKKKKAKKRR